MNARGEREHHDAADTRVWLMHGARRSAAGDGGAVSEAVGAISEIAASVGRSAVGREMAAIVTGTLPYLFDSGWQPAEVARAVRRRGSVRLEGLLVTALADDSGWNPRGYPPPPSWTAQLDQLGVHRWWGPDADWIDPWCRRVGVTWSEGVRAVIEALGIMSLVPKLEVIIPPPKAWDSLGGRYAGVVVDDAVLATVRALLAKAESTSFEAEAEALTAKAQQLMARHAIDEAVARTGRHDPSERPSARRTPVDDPYASARSSLLHVVAHANGVRSIWYPDHALMALVGFERDLDAVEVLYTSLLVQATRAMVAAGKVKDGRGHSRTRSFPPVVHHRLRLPDRGAAHRGGAGGAGRGGGGARSGPAPRPGPAGRRRAAGHGRDVPPRPARRRPVGQQPRGMARRAHRRRAGRSGAGGGAGARPGDGLSGAVPWSASLGSDARPRPRGRGRGAPE